MLTTHYPDRQNCVLLNVALSHTARAAIQQAAAAHGHRPRDFLRQTVTAAVARHQEERARQLTDQLEGLLIHHSPEELLLGAASTLLNHRRPLSSEPSSAPS